MAAHANYPHAQKAVVGCLLESHGGSRAGRNNTLICLILIYLRDAGAIPRFDTPPPLPPHHHHRQIPPIVLQDLLQRLLYCFFFSFFTASCCCHSSLWVMWHPASLRTPTFVKIRGCKQLDSLTRIQPLYNNSAPLPGGSICFHVCTVS